MTLSERVRSDYELTPWQYSIALEEARGWLEDIGAPRTLTPLDTWHVVDGNYVGGVGAFIADISALLDDEEASR